MFDGYDPQGFYCEMLRCPDAGKLRERFAAMSLAEFARRMKAAERALHALGVTFTVYSDRRRDRPHSAVRRNPAGHLGLPKPSRSVFMDFGCAALRQAQEHPRPE